MRPTVKTACLLLATVSPAAVSAQTAIATATTANLRTSTAANGAPADIAITSTGAVTPASGTAVTIDSNNMVANAGTVAINNADNSTGIAASGGVTGGITNSGTIRIDDNYAAADTNGDGVVDGPFAQGNGRTGILIGGSGTFTGNVVNSGSIIVEGNGSAAVSAVAGIAGGVQSTGAISVLGDNGTAIRLGAVGGTVAIAGTVSATGQGDVGLALTGDVGGAVVIHNAIISTGYSATSAPANPASLGADNLLQGGSAVAVGGNVAGGVLIGASLTATTDTTIDADKDGIGDSTEGAGAITVYGSAPALLVGSTARAVALGPVTGATAGLVNNGAIAASGVYAGVGATAVQIGGLGQPVSIAGGITNGGTIMSSAIGANSVALLAGSGATIAGLTNSGTLYSYGGTVAGGSTQTILIAAGASLPAIVNSGTITTTVAFAGGSAAAIVDRSGSLASIANSGTISTVDTDNDGVAIDVRSNATGFTYTQSQTSGSTVTPNLSGAILTGDGAATIAASAGTISGAIATGSGADTLALSGSASYSGAAALGGGDDRLTLADGAKFNGTIDFGSGANALTVAGGASFNGMIVNSAANVAVTVAGGGTFALSGSGAVSLSSLALAGTLGITADPTNGTASRLTVAGATTIAPGALLKVSLASVSLTPFSFTILESGRLSGSANLGLTVDSLPYLLSGTLNASDAAGTIALTIGPRAAGDFGFRRGEAGAYSAVYAAIAGNGALSTLFLSLGDRDATVSRYRQMLPDYEGGLFDMLTDGTRILAPGPNATPLGTRGDIDFWANQSWWNGRQQADLTPGYEGYGWGLAGGADIGIGGFGRIGVSIGYMYGSIDNAVRNKISANDFQGGIDWLGRWGGLRLSASGNAGYVRFGSLRTITGVSSINFDLLTSRGRWNGLLATAQAAASYELGFGHFYLRPSGTVDYARLHENRHGDAGGGVGFDLTIAARDSDELSATGLLALGLRFGGTGDAEATAFRFELEGGRRTILAGTIGDTIAHFAGGTDFVLTPEAREGGYLADAKLTVGSPVFDFSVSGGVDRRQDYHGLVGRLALRLSF